MSKETHSSHQKTGLARGLLALVFVFLCAGEFAFWKFSFPHGKPNPSLPAMPGLVVGCAMVTAIMIGAIWLRKKMARTALVVFLWVIMFVFSMPGLMMMSDRSMVQIDQLQVLGAGLAAFLIANIILIVADPIHRLGVPRGCRN